MFPFCMLFFLSVQVCYPLSLIYIHLIQNRLIPQMLSLLHSGCEKYGGQRCYTVIKLDLYCQHSARRAGNRHNFTRLPCDPVATGPQTPLHLSDERR